MAEYRPLMDVIVLFVPLLVSWILKNHFVAIADCDDEP